MSGGLDVLALKEDDVTKLLAAGAHLGDPNIDFQMAQYVYKTKPDGECSHADITSLFYTLSLLITRGGRPIIYMYK